MDPNAKEWAEFMFELYGKDQKRKNIPSNLRSVVIAATQKMNYHRLANIELFKDNERLEHENADFRARK